MGRFGPGQVLDRRRHDTGAMTVRFRRTFQKVGRMRPSIVRLIDLGTDSDFAVSMSFAQNLIQSMTVRPAGAPPAEIEFVRTRDRATVKAAFQNPAHVLHVMAHGASNPDFIGFFSEDDKTEMSLTELAEQFAFDHEGIEAAVIYADCCDSGQGRFTRAIRDCIEQPTIYIGARREVDWHEGTVFASAFYGSFFKDRGFGLSPQDRGLQAAERAVAAYETLTDGECPFRAQELTPSRLAKRSLGLS